MKILAGIIGGLILAILGALLVTVMFAGSKGSGASLGVISFLVLWGVGILIGVRASSASKAWRKLLIACAVLSFLLPISGLIYTGSFMANNVDLSAQHGGAAAAGAAIGGGLISGFMGFVGFFLGIVFLVIGLLVGRDKQIVYVQAPPDSR